MQFLFIEKSKRNPVCHSLCLSVQSVFTVCTVCTVCPACLSDPNLGLTQLMYITELVNPGDVRQLKVLNGAKECFGATVSVLYKSLFTIQYGTNDNEKTNKKKNIHSKLLHTMTVI